MARGCAKQRYRAASALPRAMRLLHVVVQCLFGHVLSAARFRAPVFASPHPAAITASAAQSLGDMADAVNVSTDETIWPIPDEDLMDEGNQEAMRFFAALNSTGTRVDVNRPACAHHLPARHPYWRQQDHYGFKRNFKCMKDGCPQITNADRVNSLRRLLSVTDKLMKFFHADYFLYAGTAVGQQRCGDVLPWDKDNDILVPRTHLLRIQKAVFGEKWVSTPRGRHVPGKMGYNTESPDLRRWGLPPGYKLIRYSECIMFKILDTKTGFLTDVFPLDIGARKVVTPWPGGPHHCQSWPHCSTGCYGWWRATVFPLRPCKMSSVWMQCSRNQPRFLVSKYGQKVLTTPDVKVSTR